MRRWDTAGETLRILHTALCVRGIRDVSELKSFLISFYLNYLTFRIDGILTIIFLFFVPLL